MRNVMKVMSILTVILMVVCLCTPVFAAKVDVKNMDKQDIDSEAAGKMETIGGTIVAYVTNAAMVVSIVMIAVLGIKYMLGSAEEKAEYKKSLVPLLVGAILVFGAAAIAKVIVGLAGTFGGSSSNP